MSEPPEQAPRSAGLVRRVVPAAALVVVWVLLWGTFSWANVLSGTLVAALVLRVFPLPHVPGSGWLRPWAALRFLGVLTAELARSSLQVAAQSVRPGPEVRSSVVAVRLASTSEFVQAMVIETLSLIPGSVVIDTDPDGRVLYAHVLGCDDDAAVEAFRATVARWESALVEALGRPASPRPGPSRPDGAAR